MKLEVHEIQALKGRRQLTELNVQSVEHSKAAEAAGIDIIVSGYWPEFAARRAAAPNTHFCFGLVYGHHVNADEAKRAAFQAMEAGADSIYCAMNFDIVEQMAKEGIPVVGHAGLVPQKYRWTGMRAFGRTLAEARSIMDVMRHYEDAGAFAVELEVVAEPVATAISRATPLTVISMGSGAGCDVQYLFAVDILGETTGHVPRHARVYDNFAAEYDRLHDRRVKAFSSFRDEVAGGQFPDPSEIVNLKSEEAEALAEFLADPRQQEKP
ncbi:MAG: 3-methyl-2-oxobutanoate hydroxymethyltransferase [Marivivens sp.]|nr:3-methyl-2-oxobutanoate hydroxymethyltransferase [Marivivens sp.]